MFRRLVVSARRFYFTVADAPRRTSISCITSPLIPTLLELIEHRVSCLWVQCWQLIRPSKTWEMCHLNEATPDEGQQQSGFKAFNDCMCRRSTYPRVFSRQRRLYVSRLATRLSAKCGRFLIGIKSDYKRQNILSWGTIKSAFSEVHTSKHMASLDAFNLPKPDFPNRCLKIVVIRLSLVVIQCCFSFHAFSDQQSTGLEASIISAN